MEQLQLRYFNFKYIQVLYISVNNRCNRCNREMNFGVLQVESLFLSFHIRNSQWKEFGLSSFDARCRCDAGLLLTLRSAFQALAGRRLEKYHSGATEMQAVLIQLVSLCLNVSNYDAKTARKRSCLHV